MEKYNKHLLIKGEVTSIYCEIHDRQQKFYIEIDGIKNHATISLTKEQTIQLIEFLQEKVKKME